MAKTFNDVYQPITVEELSRIPEEMKQEPRWICWGSNKVPVSVAAAQNGNHFGINVTDSANWGTFEQATAAIGNPAYVKYADEYFHIAGIGFVTGDGWFCADLDGGAGHNKEDVPESAIMDAVNVMQTYAEKSLSGCGYHVFGKCDFSTTNAEHNKPHRGQDRKPVPESYEVEFFTRRKFIAITGRKVSGSSADATDCSAAALDFYTRYILNDWNKDEAERATERAKISASAPINNDDAAEMFRLNYPEILAASDSSNFKRGGKGVTLAAGEYSWIGALKAMQEIGIPESAIIEWCRRGSNFRSEKDVQKVLNKSSKPGAASVAGIIKDAQAHGWKPDPDKLTGEYKQKHEKRLQREEENEQFIIEFKKAHKERHTAALAAIGIEYSDTLTWTYDFDGNIEQVTDTATGEVIYTKPEQLPGGGTINQAKPIQPAAPAKDPKPKKEQLTVDGFDDVEIKPTDYLFFPWFPRGKLVAVQGDSSSSKSTFMYGVGAKTSTGSDLLGAPCEDPGNVMFITIEDDAADIKIAFMDSGGDLSKLRRIREREQIAKLDLSPDGAAVLDKIIKGENIKLLVLDPLQQFLSGDMNKANETRPQLGRLMNIAAENNICIVFLEHMGKDTSKSALHRGIGSVDIGAATRSILQVVTDPEDDYYKIAFTVKNNTADFHDTQRAIRYQVKDHPNSFNHETGKRERFHGHAEFIDLLPEYNEKLFRKATRKSEEAEMEEISLAFEYHNDPLVLTARELISQNPQGLFIGADDLIQKITFVCGHCPYDQTKNKSTGINARVTKLRNLLIEEDGIQADIQSNSIYPKPYNWRGEVVAPEHIRTKGIMFTAVKAAMEGYQQTKI